MTKDEMVLHDEIDYLNANIQELEEDKQGYIAAQNLYRINDKRQQKRIAELQSAITEAIPNIGTSFSSDARELLEEVMKGTK